MTLDQWIGIVTIAALLTFVIFAFRQGFKVKPDNRGDHRGYGGSDDGGHSGSDGGH
jgi:hypothetical protein